MCFVAMGPWMAVLTRVVLNPVLPDSIKLGLPCQVHLLREGVLVRAESLLAKGLGLPEAWALYVLLVSGAIRG